MGNRSSLREEIKGIFSGSIFLLCLSSVCSSPICHVIELVTHVWKYYLSYVVSCFSYSSINFLNILMGFYFISKSPVAHNASFDYNTLIKWILLKYCIITHLTLYSMKLLLVILIAVLYRFFSLSESEFLV